LLRAIGYKSKKFENIIFKLFAVVITSFFIFGFLNLPALADENELPDIKILSIDYDNTLYEYEKAEFIVDIKNIGDKNITSEEIKIGLFIDQSSDPISHNSTFADLDIGDSRYVNISWTPNFGDDETHIIRIVANYEELFDEKNFDNNIVDFHVIIKEKTTSLDIIDVIFPDNILVNETSIITASVINSGKTTDKKIIAKMNTSIDGEIDVIEKIGLERDEIYDFKFNWIPSKTAVQKISINVFLEDNLHDTYEKNIAVSGRIFDWWDENWHYRYLLSVEGDGNFSKFFNFSEILLDFGISDYIFENNKIRIVKYFEDGTISDVIDKYIFVESDGFDSTNNATGYLKWNVSNESGIKHYVIYFDVEENRGSRSSLVETYIGNASDLVETVYEEFYESWWAEIKSPTDTSLILLGDTINISIVSTSKIIYASCYISNIENDSYNYSPDLSEALDGTIWYNEALSFCKEGNWSINISCLDGAGVYYNFSDTFYVGHPDLKITGISFSVINKNYTTVHKDDNLNISAFIKTSSVSLENVNFLLEIFDIENDKIIYEDIATFDLIKDKITAVYFNWIANISGEFNISVYSDFDDNVNEKNESNNNMTKKLTVYDWPDLYVKDILLPDKEIIEFDEVEIDVLIANQGFGDADDYKIGLFIEKISGSNPAMKYENLVDSKIIDVKKNSSESFNLYWESASPGNWFVGIEIFYNESNYDTNRWNNKLLSLDSLYVKSVESNEPIIRNITVSPVSPKQGDTIIFKAIIYDDTGIERADINITDPLNNTYSDIMVRTFGDQFRYEFDSTFEIGTYEFIIKVVDNSIRKNVNIQHGSFTIKKDDIEPEIFYFGVEPIVQLKNNTVKITCIASDNIEISNVEITIFPPEALLYKRVMKLEQDGEYVYKDIYLSVGKYGYEMELKDVSGNVKKTNTKYFWITEDLYDSDSDGMPNSWEKEYDFDSFDMSDADDDTDDDGYTNLEEYHMNTNPRKNIFLQNIAYEIKNNLGYLFLSIILFFSLLIVTFYGKRRVI